MSIHTPFITGVYHTTEEFRAIEDHAAVCQAWTGMLIAVCGPANDEDSQKVAQLFASAPDMQHACIKALAFIQANHPNETQLIYDLSHALDWSKGQA
jgi:hypothetical protein